MKITIKDFVVGLLALCGAIAFILVIGFAGAVEQDMLAFGDGVLRIGICMGAFLIIALVIYLLGRDE